LTKSGGIVLTEHTGLLGRLLLLILTEQTEARRLSLILSAE